MNAQRYRYIRLIRYLVCLPSYQQMRQMFIQSMTSMSPSCQSAGMTDGSSQSLLMVQHIGKPWPYYDDHIRQPCSIAIAWYANPSYQQVVYRYKTPKLPVLCNAYQEHEAAIVSEVSHVGVSPCLDCEPGSLLQVPRLEAWKQRVTESHMRCAQTGTVRKATTEVHRVQSSSKQAQPPTTGIGNR